MVFHTVVVSTPLTVRECDSVIDLAGRVRREGRTWCDLATDEESLPELAATLAAARREVYEGRGLVLLRGLPMDDLDEDKTAVVSGLPPLRGERPTSRRDREACGQRTLTGAGQLPASRS